MAGLNSTQVFALTALIALLLTSGLTQARDWRWYPRKAPADSGALRPDLEGTRDDDEQREMSELDELRQWLRQRDEDRRRQGITVPDTVDQLEPRRDFGATQRQWPEGSTPRLPDRRSPEAIMDDERTLEEQSERVRRALFPHFSGKRTSRFSRHMWRPRTSPSQGVFRHRAAGAGRKGAGTRRRH